MTKIKTRNFELDRLRAFAVVMTIFIHYSRIFFPWNIQTDYKPGGTFFHILENSWAGVDLFFVISGYIISKMMVEKIDSLVKNKELLANEIKNFYIRRFFRIYPLAFTFFIFVLVCSLIFNSSGYFSTAENTLEAGISIFTYTFDYYFAAGHYHSFSLSPYWSLSVEEQFYLFFPFFLIFFKSHKSRILILVSMLLLISFVIRPLSKDNIFLTQNRCDGLIYGALFYYLSIQGYFKNLFQQVRGNSFTTIGIVSVIVFLLWTITAVGFPNYAVIPLSCIMSTILVALASLEVKFISFGNWINKILNYLGSRSFSLYIVHLPMFTITQEIFFRLSHSYKWELNSGFKIYYSVVAFLLSFIVSELSYRCIEKPFLKKGQKFNEKNNPIQSQPKEVKKFMSIA